MSPMEKMLRTTDDEEGYSRRVFAGLDELYFSKYEELHRLGITDKDLAATGWKHVRQCSSLNGDPKGCKKAHTSGSAKPSDLGPKPSHR